jgi:hypothetical protein
MLPGLLDRLTPGEADRIVGAAPQTIRAGRHLPHAELQPALL